MLLSYLIKPLQIKYYTNFKKRNHRNLNRSRILSYCQIEHPFPFNYTIPEDDLMGFIYISRLQRWQIINLLTQYYGLQLRLGIKFKIY